MWKENVARSFCTFLKNTFNKELFVQLFPGVKKGNNVNIGVVRLDKKKIKRIIGICLKGPRTVAKKNR